MHWELHYETRTPWGLAIMRHHRVLLMQDAYVASVTCVDTPSGIDISVEFERGESEPERAELRGLNHRYSRTYVPVLPAHILCDLEKEARIRSQAMYDNALDYVTTRVPESPVPAWISPGKYAKKISGGYVRIVDIVVQAPQFVRVAKLNVWTRIEEPAHTVSLGDMIREYRASECPPKPRNAYELLLATDEIL